MKGTTKEILGLIGTLVMAYLLLVHATGFSRDVSSIASGSGGLIKTLQGR